MGQKDDLQYQVLHERTWHYNDLLWKNILAYGAVLYGTGQLLDSKESGLGSWTVFLLGGLILSGLGFLQIALTNGLGRTIERVMALEVGNSGLKRITTGPKDAGVFAVQNAYLAAGWLMWHRAGKAGKKRDTTFGKICWTPGVENVLQASNVGSRSSASHL